MTAMNFIVAYVLFFYATYAYFRGRREAQSMLGVYALAGAWSVIVYTLVMIDYLLVDFMTWQVVTGYLIRPLLFILLCTILGATIRSGWRYDGK